MRILMLLSRIPYPLEKGDKLRAFHQIKYLSQNNEIILVALNDRKVNKMEAFQFLQPYCRSVNFFDLPLPLRLYNIIKAYFNGKPFQVGYFFRNKIKMEIEILMDEYKPDHLYCQLTRVAEYGKDINIPKTLDYQDAFSFGLERRIKFSKGIQRHFLKIERQRMHQYESAIFSHFDQKIIISDADKEKINHELKDEIKVIKNGVDTEFYKSNMLKKTHDIIFSGNMNYPPNILASNFLVKDILPILHNLNIRPKLYLAGAKPHKRVRQLSTDQISVTGWVEDLRPFYDQSKIFVAPMFTGTGLQNKILEAMSMGLACVTSSIVNQTINAKENEEVLVANSAQEFADQINYLLKNPDRVIEIGRKGRTFVQQNFSWEKAGKKLEKVIKQNK